MNPSRFVPLSLIISVAIGGTTNVLARTLEVNTSSCPGVEMMTSVAVAPQEVIGVFKLSGGIRTSPAGGLFDMMSGVCHGTLNTVGGKRLAMGNCVWADKDGDKVVFQFHRDGAGAGKTEITAGTGKFSAVKGGSQYNVVQMPALPGTMNTCIDAIWKLDLPQ